MTDPIRAAMQEREDTRRARRDSTYVQALLAGNAPTVASYISALESGLTGEEALQAARELDQAAADFTPPTDDNPPAAA